MHGQEQMHVGRLRRGQMHVNHRILNHLSCIDRDFKNKLTVSLTIFNLNTLCLLE